MVVLPDEIAVTRPVALTEAMPGVLLNQVPPARPVVLSWVDDDTHKEEVPLIVPALAFGFTVIVKVIGEPVQPFKDGVTVTVVVIGLTLLLMAVKAPILPVPFRPKPTLLVLVQLYITVPPVVGLLKLIKPGLLEQ